MNKFNDIMFVQEFKELVDSLNIKNLLEIGCQSDELRNSLSEDIQTTGIVDIQDYKAKKKFDLIFSSGLLQRLEEDKIIETIKKMTSLSKKYILNYVPNSNCNAYMNNKAKTKTEWKYEKDFTIDSLRAIYDIAGLDVVQAGVVANEWAKKFGSEPSDGYLVYVLAEKKVD